VAGEPVGQRALVTGATSGIGLAIALELARRGCCLTLVARDADRLSTTAAQARRVGSPASDVLVADLLESSDLDRVAAVAGEYDIVVNAAGMGTTYPFPDQDLATELAQLDLNVRAVLVISHAAARAMAERGAGRILNVGSTAAIWSRGSYAGSKAWVHAVTRGLDARYRPRGVTATLLVPGFTRTRFHARSATATDGVARWLWLTPERVAAEGVAATLAGRGECVPGRRYRLLTGVAQRLRPGARGRLLAAVARLRPAD
jgi:short-subunit dehydrogenase